MNLKQKKYKRLQEQLIPLLKNSPGFLSQLATINAILYHKMKGFFWVGWYFVSKENLLVGPYQGALACQTLKKPNGVCWTAILEKKVIVVDDVNKFPGHIACDSRTNSEIVIPLMNNSGEIFAVLDIDSDQKANFDKYDVEELQKILELINTKFKEGFNYC